jgi:Flp pilus assembly protein TadG
MIDAGLRKLAAAARSLWADTDGVILPYVTLMLVVFIGVAVLALDGARYMSLQTQLQKGADALAVAGSAELDRLPDAITRATNAVNNLVTNSSLFGTGGNVNVSVSSVRFMSSLPASDITYPIPSANVTTNPIQARFIEVTVQPVTIPTILPASFFGGVTSVTAGATAVAGNDGVVCGLTPMFICNPFEQVGDSYAQATARLVAASTDAAMRRTLLRFSDGSNNSGTWGPGDFGYLVPDSGSLAPDSCFPAAGSNIGPAMAASRPLICVRQNGVDLQPGNATAAIEGLNTRFGLYTPSMASSCMATYPPDLNVRKGYREGSSGSPAERWCRADPDGSPTGNPPTWPDGISGKSLPVDPCFNTSTCSPANMGASNWDCQTYWGAAHTANPTALADPPTGCTAAATVSRYDVYQYEIAKNYHTDAQLVTFETGAPQCSAATAQANRRIMNVAIVNCMSSPVTIQSNAQDVPVAAFGRFFLTVPVPVAAQNKPYAEFLGFLERGGGGGSGGNGGLFDHVQLYR